MKLNMEKTLAHFFPTKINYQDKLMKIPRAFNKISYFTSLLFALGLAILLSLNLISVGSAQAAPDFTIIVLPDTQHYTDNPLNYANFSAQTQWIVDNRVTLNIKFVTHLGDIVEHGNNNGDDTEWLVADAAMGLLEDPVKTLLTDGIPYGAAPGNHDQGDNGEGPYGETASFNEFFGVTRFQGRGYYGGSYDPTLNDNNYELFSAGAYDFIIIHLDYHGTRPTAELTWADDLLNTYSDRRAIVVTHYMLDKELPVSFSGQGQAIYDALKDNPNLSMMLGGHRVGEGRREDTYNGNTVHSLLSNYQGEPGGGNGWLRIMEFSPADNEIRVKTYSPVLDRFQTDADSQFTLFYEANAPPAVDAGPDQTISFGESATLDGTVSDDGVPEPGAVTTTWSVITVPQTGVEVFFADPNAVDTTATFPVIGDYVLHLTADDGQLSAFDEITITVNPNQPPTVNAGPNQTISLPNNANLNGTVTDDGLPSLPGEVTTNWTRVSGPGPVNFADASAVDTTASFSNEGDYILSLTADDGGTPLVSDEVTITVNSAPNQPPFVDAGPNQTITLPASAILDGTVTDDGLPNPPNLTTLWLKGIGPGSVTFADASLVDTTAIFSEDGVYQLLLSAEDSELSAIDTILISVNPAPLRYIWLPVILSVPTNR